jgi:4-amino-4-deoxy-L-arabinose transferase-like glycosyltransferase
VRETALRAPVLPVGRGSLPSDPRGWALPVLAAVGAVTLARIGLLAFDRVPLWVDEAQYWLWGQDLAFGYYSKPPLIGWLLRLVSETCGDSAFCIRLPGPLLHGATAVILGGVAARWWGARAALPVAAGYATLPMAAVGSAQMATDTLMAPFLALALGAWLACLLGGAGRRMAVAAGAAIGVAFLAKYAAALFLPGAVLAWLLVRPRPGAGHVAALFGGFLVAAAPNVAWNLAAGLPTLAHTLDNTGWAREARTTLHPGALAQFLAEQAAFVGPVVFGGLVGMALRWRRLAPPSRVVLAFALPVLAAFCVQALLSHALVNWAGAAWLAATLAVMPWLSRGWRAVSLGLNGAFCVALPLIAAMPERVVLPGGRPLLERYLGRPEMSAVILETAREAGLDVVVASDRDVLADLFHAARGRGLTIRSTPPGGRAMNHYQFHYPYDPATPGAALLVMRADRDPPCPGAALLAEHRPAIGAYREKPQALWRVPEGCLNPG